VKFKRQRVINQNLQKCPFFWRSFMRAAALLLILSLVFTPGCATLTGASTGAFTGAVDLPSETYKKSDSLREDAFLFPFLVVIVGGLGAAGGPVAGLAKGFSDDVQWVIGWVGYDKIFGSFENVSVWRPWTFTVEDGRNVEETDSDEQ
jgi:hypothetical protein